MNGVQEEVTMNEATAFSFLTSGGQAAELIRNRAWDHTPLGPPQHWPALLKSSLATALTSPLPTAIIWGKAMVSFCNTAFLANGAGRAQAMGGPIEAIFPTAREHVLPLVQMAYAGKASVLEDFQPEPAGFATATLYLNPLCDAAGQPVGVQLLLLQKAMQTGANSQSRAHTADLQHRLKNVFATINSIISQTLRDERPLAQLKPVLIQRISALSSAHAFAADTSKPLTMRPLIIAALGPHLTDQGKITLEGPDIPLHEKQAISLFLGIQELLANATKHGALSQQTGTIAIRWHQPSPESLEFVWQESGGPPVVQPMKKGFGTVIVERVLPHDFAGRGEFTFAPDGLRYSLFAGKMPPS